MVRSMYSGVAGLRSHQTRMDTIGNNIANVNTYGFKSGRTTFRDIYYQQLRGSSTPTGAQGGINPSSVGYGSKVGSVDLMMGNSTFSMTDQTMDIAVDGEGFFQVQDSAGNTYYTRAGMLSFDAAGNLVDMQGNYVLGVNGDPTGRAAASERISVALGPVPPTAASVVQEINGKEFTVSATNPTPDGNMNFSFTTDSSLADGDVVASISTTGIIIKFNPQKQYTNIDDLNSDINTAITNANNGVPHVAGNFTVTYTGDPAQDPFAALTAANALSAKELCDTNYNIVKGGLPLATSFWGGMTTTGNVGNTFGKSFPNAGDPLNPPTMSAITGSYSDDGSGAGGVWTFRMVIDNVTYEGSVGIAQNSAGKLKLVNTDGDQNDFIEISRPSFDRITEAWKQEKGGLGSPAQYTATLTPLTPMTAGATINIGDATAENGGIFTVGTAADQPTLNAQMTAFAQYLNRNGYTGASFDPISGRLSFTDAAPANRAAAPTFTGLPGATVAFQQDANGVDIAGTNPAPPVTNGAEFNTIQSHAGTAADPWPTPAMETLWNALGARTATTSRASRNLGLSGSAFALRGGTAGGDQSLADMTDIQIGTNGIIIGKDAIGRDVIIGRIDLATFANPGGLNQAGSSNYTESQNSGPLILNAPGQGGAGQLVGGTLELSNVDLAREFSDMITTQRGYQANSRIITVSDTMLEELINLKR